MRLEVQKYYCPGRLESASFLMWYLRNFFRLEEEDAIASVCDSQNDKGIDGIYVDDDEEEVHLFQSKFSPEYAKNQGDNDLRNFVGAKQWFTGAESVESLLKSTASEELKQLVIATNVFEHISSDYTVFSHFVTNKIFDHNAKEFLDVSKSELIGHDLLNIFDEYTYMADKITSTGVTKLKLKNGTKIDYDLSDGPKARVYAIPVTELMTLNGIQDRSLFYRNVRYGLGKNTRVNKDIKATIRNPRQHDRFFLFHNGITLVCDALEDTDNELTLTNYSVINGCQSMLTLYENRHMITDRMYILAKIIQLDQTSPLVSDITYYTNNQNPIKLEDLKADDRVHKAIQSQFAELLGNKVLYKRKRGESEAGYDRVIELDFAAQLIEAFYNGNPQNTHVRGRLFGERYSSIFSRHINAAKIYFAYLVYQTILDNIASIKTAQVQSYGLTHFFLLHLIAEVLREDDLGRQFVEDPTRCVKEESGRLTKAIAVLIQLLAPDVDAYFAEYAKNHNGFFDYKNVFKSAEFVTNATTRLLTDNKKTMVRHPEDAFSSIYKSIASGSE